MLARTAVQPRVLVALIQCATIATEVVEIATESEKDVVINCVAIFYEERKEGRILAKITSFVVIVGLYVRAVSVFGKKNPKRFPVFWRISVRFCGFRTPLTPPSFCILYEISTIKRQ